jgi:serine/threonine protein phosphatase PrpC
LEFNVLNIVFSIYAESDIGASREKNEDMLLVTSKKIRDAVWSNSILVEGNLSKMLFAVADGIGGASAGEVASEFVLNRMREAIVLLPKSLNVGELKAWLMDRSKFIHKELLQISKSSIDHQGMGTTLTGLLFYENNFYVLHAGDSRLYRWRDDVLRQVTTDHSLQSIGAEITTSSNVITNSFGGGENFFLDVDYASIGVFDNDIFLLCTDGLSDVVSDECLQEALSNKETSKHLVNLALENNSKDNISYIVIRVNMEIDKLCGA